MKKNNFLVGKLFENVEKYQSKEVVFGTTKKGDWKGISWTEFGSMIENTAKNLIEWNLKEGECIGIFSQNMPEWTITDYATQAIKAISVPLYPTASVQQACYIMNETEATLLFVGEQDQYDKAVEICKQSPKIQKVIAFDSDIKFNSETPSCYFSELLQENTHAETENILNNRTLSATIDDLITIIYTSGTSGEPKGVMLHNRQFLHALDIHDIRLNIDDTDVSLCYLPLSHVFERAWEFVVLSKCIQVYYVRNPKDVVKAVSYVKPTLMCVVPRFFEKTYAAVISKVETFSPFKKALFKWALHQGEKRAMCFSKEKKLSASLKLNYWIADKLVLAKGRSVLGGRIKFMPCAGAALSEEIIHFFHNVGLHIKYGYGLSETTATVACFPDTGYKYGSVGKLMPDVEVKIGENDEILVKGATVTSGYFKKPKETAEAFINGWFRTGDAGYIDENGHISLTDRIKDLMKTSSGKYIAPQQLETLVGSNKYIDHIAIIGNERKYVTALIVPSFDMLREHARKLNFNYHTHTELIKRPEIIALYQEIINNAQKAMASFEKIQRFTLLPEEFTIPGGELTTTLKVKRNFVAKKYQREIEMMYA
jgi:long-chain acyl-CoA synthetase